MPRKLIALILLAVAVVVNGCASDLKLGVATNEAPPTPQELPH
jgi:hypothetical protein